MSIILKFDTANDQITVTVIKHYLVDVSANKNGKIFTRRVGFVVGRSRVCASERFGVDIVGNEKCAIRIARKLLKKLDLATVFVRNVARSAYRCGGLRYAKIEESLQVCSQFTVKKV